MDDLLERIFQDYCVYSAQPPSLEYQAQSQIVSNYHNRIAKVLGDAFSDELWHAHSQLALVEMREAFQFGLHLARSF